MTFVLWLAFGAHAFDHGYAKWDALLKAYVVESGATSLVKYHDLKAAQLAPVRQELEAVSADEFKTWNEPQRQAFLINAYNVFTVQWILQNGIPASIKDTGHFWRSPWRQKFFKLLGEETNLEQIEDRLVHDPASSCRLHLALSNASRGGPRLRARAWEGTSLKADLESAVDAFVGDSNRNSYEAAHASLELSQLFNWYQKDFVACAGSVRAFVTPYLKVPVPEAALVKYQEFDWRLNGVQ